MLLVLIVARMLCEFVRGVVSSWLSVCGGIQISRTSWGGMGDILARNYHNEPSVRRYGQSNGDDAIVSRSLHVVTPPHDVQET
jgi:hypothetical protein